MGYFSSNLLNSTFFIDSNIVGAHLTPGEIDCTILPSFPHAEYQNMRYVAVPGLIITHDYPLKGEMTISVERVIESRPLYLNNNRMVILPIKQE